IQYSLAIASNLSFITVYTYMSVFHIITPCTRLNNLAKMKSNILAVKGKRDVIWHICFDSLRTQHNQRNDIKNKLEDLWIFFYEAGTSFNNPGKAQVNFVLTHFKIGLFEGFTYVLDDDNKLPPDFFNYNYNLQESKIYLIPQIRRGETCPPIVKIDR